VSLQQGVETLRSEAESLRGELEAQKSVREERMQRLRERVGEIRDQRAGDGAGPQTLREAFADPNSMARMGRALLHRNEKGAFDGYRLSGLRRGSLGDRIGLENGDIIHSGSGHELTSIQAAMEAFQQLQSATELEVKLSRRGQPVTLKIPVDEPPSP